MIPRNFKGKSPQTAGKQKQDGHNACGG